ncbi:Ku protein [Streptomyces sp. WAC01280]|uniref:non-homologous end joining protein Ku n=1 Tax=Streptomyces sp. WAC01280 TaxID=2487424 RepID=UPI000F78170B|nr:Ku protein [Streptomyces sp. WAC01280]RSS57456.1 Ku protein [Streptomyces sp. WAC01280]
MPRPLWSGAISFGLVTVPIKLETATEKHDVSLRQVHVEDGGRIRYRKVCDLDGQELREDEIGKGYEISKDHVIPITDEDLADMPLPTAKAIEIVAFIDRTAVDTVQYGAGSYYLTADGAVATKPYVLLRQALDRTEKVAVAKFALRGRERLGLLRPLGNALLLSGLHWGDEIRSPAELAPPETDLTDNEVEGALALMDTMSVDSLDDLDVTDHYTEALHEVIAAKAEHRAPKPAEGEEAAAGPVVVDLMAALEKSVAEARERRGETSGRDRGEATVHEMPKPKKKAAAKKPPDKKAPARRKKTA